MEKGLQKTNDSTLVSSQERKARAVLLIIRWSTAGFVRPSVYKKNLCSRWQKDLQDSFPGYLGGLEASCLLGNPTCRHPVLPGPTAPRRAAPPCAAPT